MAGASKHCIGPAAYVGETVRWAAEAIPLQRHSAGQPVTATLQSSQRQGTHKAPASFQRIGRSREITSLGHSCVRRCSISAGRTTYQPNVQ